LPLTDDTRQVRGPLLDLDTIREHYRNAEAERTFSALWTAAADIPALLAEIDRLYSLLCLARILHANLTAAVYATIAADRVVHPRRGRHHRQASAALAECP
jgi:hypothetical protein